MTIEKRWLSWIYFFGKDENGEREPRVFEDLTEEEQDAILARGEPEFIKNLAKGLAKSLRGIGDKFDILTSHE